MFQSPNVKVNTIDEKLIQTIHEQNTKILDKLEMLYSKHELLSSNQLQLFEMVSMLSKKVEDVLIMPNECYLDGLTATEQLPSPQQPASVAPSLNSSFSCKSSAPSLTQTLAGNGLYPLQPNAQTGFFRYPSTPASQPIFQLPYPILNPSIPILNPDIPFLNHNRFVPETKESYTMINRSIASTNVFNTNVPLSSTPKKSLLDTSKEIALNEAFEHGHSNMLREIYNNSVSKEPPKFSHDEDVNSEFARGRLSGAIDFVQNSKMFEGGNATKTPTPSLVEQTANLSSHSFQIPNVTPVVQSPSVQVPEDEEESDDEKTAEHDPIPDFKPIIPLPDEVNVKTGEEEEEVLFENRAKLFRYADKEWKERGTGPLKILKNPNTGRVRILMRRDVVHKVCANHFLSDEMNLTPASSSDRAWVYCAADFADEKMNIEKLCFKFKTVELAQEFYKIFNDSKRSSSTAVITSTSPAKKTTSVLKAALTETTKKVVLAPPVVTVEDKHDESKTLLGGFTFSGKPIISTSLTEKEPERAEEKKKMPFSSFSGFSLNTLSRTTGESKLFQNTVPTTTFSTTESDHTKPFASVKNTIDFSTLSKNADTSSFLKSKDFKGFPGAGSLVFGEAKTCSKQSTTVQAILQNVSSKTESKITQPADVKNDSCASNEDEFVPTAEFMPAIPMPDLIEVKTGEEGLQVCFEDHCKLFRYVGGEWKERGRGKMKILRDDKDGSVRLVMRRDQVHKVCCNHRLTKNQELKPLKNSESAWTWYAQDFSDGELKNETLCIRFKTVDQVSYR